MAKCIIIASKNIFKLHSIYKILISSHAFATFDKNNDGSIDFDEFLMAMAISNKGNLDDRLGVAFDL
jgi:Ca2+-binding EF-hand superfamily protein